MINCILHLYVTKTRKGLAIRHCRSIVSRYKGTDMHRSDQVTKLMHEKCGQQTERCGRPTMVFSDLCKYLYFR
jgi:hypothetical protein